MNDENQNAKEGWAELFEADPAKISMEDVSPKKYTTPLFDEEQ
jgi:hypothetical protein